MSKDISRDMWKDLSYSKKADLAMYDSSNLLLFGVVFIGAAETIQALNQMILVPLKYHPELSRAKGMIPVISKVIKEDRLSVFVIYTMEYSLIVLFVVLQAFGLIGSGAMTLPVIAAGFSLIVLGESFRLWATYTLGRFFTYVVVTTKRQKLVAHGPYRFVRHPAYLGGLLIFAGLGILSQSMFVAFFYVFFMSIAYAYRIHVEENALSRRFGNEYARYAKKTFRIIPYAI